MVLFARIKQQEFLVFLSIVINVFLRGIQFYESVTIQPEFRSKLYIVHLALEYFGEIP